MPWGGLTESETIALFKLTQQPSAVVYVDGTAIIARKSNGEEVYRGVAGTADDGEAIQAAFDAMPTSGAWVFIKPKEDGSPYKVTATITPQDYSILQGVFGRTAGKGTTIQWTGAAGGTVFDYFDKHGYQVVGIRVDGNNLADVAFKIGATNLPHVTNVSFHHVVVQTLRNTGSAFKDGTGTAKVQDSIFFDCIIETAGIAYDSLHTANKIIGGTIAGCAIAGIRAVPASSLTVIGVIFSGNGVDVQYYGDDTVNIYSFANCWFENSVTAIIQRPNVPAITKAIGGLFFAQCLLHTSSAGQLLDLRNIKANLGIVNCKIDGAAASWLIRADATEETRLSIGNCTGADLLTLSGNIIGPHVSVYELVRGEVTGPVSVGFDFINSSVEFQLNGEPWEDLKAELVIYWNPATASGGIHLRSATPTMLVESTPGAAGNRRDVLAIPISTWRGLTKNDFIQLLAKGDGGTGATIYYAYVRVYR